MGQILARLRRLTGRMEEGRPAIRPIEPARRLQRLAQWTTQAQIAAAELELNEWRRQGDCPAAARVLLAAITARRGELEAALAILGDARDPEAMKLRITLLVELNRLVEAHQAVEQLHHEHGRDPALDEWFAAVDAPGAETLPIVSDAAADHLASDLCERIDLLPTLVAAQKIRPDLPTVRLLCEALPRVVDRVNDPRQVLSVCEAMAELSLLLGDEIEARQWAHRGLRIDAYYAPLALVLSRIADDPAVGPPAVQVLDATAKRHPRYRDVLAALIRRQFAAGDTKAARKRLQQWAEQEPQHPIVKALNKELVA